MNVTIVGGGFAGVKTALELAKDANSRITLITDKPDFQYYPALYGAATGRNYLESWVPLSKIFKNVKNIEVIFDSILSIDSESKTLTGKEKTYSYSTCVLALGTVTTYFGIEGLESHTYGIKSAAEIQKLKQHVYEDMAHGQSSDKRYIVIGAGPTGVELAAALGSYLQSLAEHFKVEKANVRVEIIEAAPRILPRMSEKSSKIVERRLEKLGVVVKTGKAVESASDDGLVVSGELLVSDATIWTSGVANHPFYKANSDTFTFAPNGRVVVDAYMQVKKDLYVIGDNAATPYTGLAQTALHDAIFLAKHLRRVEEKQDLKEYTAVMPPVVVPVGTGWAVFEWKKIQLHGWPASIIRRLADFMGYSDILPLGQALGVWRAGVKKQKIGE